MPGGLLAAFIVVSLGGSVLVAFLLTAHGRSAAAATPRQLTTATLGGFTQRGLVLSSIFGLYLELLLIRWISSEIRIFAYFKNLVLIACFLGFGLGCYLCKRAISVAMLAAPLIFLTALITLPIPSLRLLIRALPALLGASSNVQIWGIASVEMGGAAVVGLMLAAIVTLPLFALLAVTFIPVGQLVGAYLESAPRGIAAYTVNVLASLAGIALYTTLCFLDQPPLVWFLVAMLLAAALFWPVRQAAAIVTGAFLLCAAMITWGSAGQEGETWWSPYQKLTVVPEVVDGETIGYELQTNSSWYQKIVNLSPEFVARHPQFFRDVPAELNGFNLAYRFAPHPKSVLILGSGMGSDVAAALRAGAEHVTAVEIDPLILKLGKRLHPEHPYQSPRVTIVNDDARSFIQNTDQHFDVIVFSLLDSHTTSSHFTNIRIDNYVYTREAIAAGRHLLTPDGVYVLRFQVLRPWIAGRLHDLMTTVFGYEPLHVESIPTKYSTGGDFFVAGFRPRIVASLADPAFRAYVAAHSALAIEHVNLTTDDWPYFYQRDPGLPAAVVTISILLLVVCFVAARRVGLQASSIHWELFFLGAGFLLLEAQIVSRMALLFGTTWIVNSLVIAVLLLLIVAANGVAAAFPRLPAGAAYIGILVSIAVCYLLPLDALFFRSFLLRATLSTLVLCSPVFFAGIVFIRRFAAAGFAAGAIGSNLLGSLAGGILESLSLWLGLKALLLLAILLYGAAAFSQFRRRFNYDSPQDSPQLTT